MKRFFPGRKWKARQKDATQPAHTRVLLLGIVWKKVTSQLRDTLYQQWTSWPKSYGCETKQRMNFRSHSIACLLACWDEKGCGNFLTGSFSRKLILRFPGKILQERIFTICLVQTSWGKIERTKEYLWKIFFQEYLYIIFWYFLETVFYAKMKRFK